MSDLNNERNNKEFSQWLKFDYLFGYLYEVKELPDCNPPLYSAVISVPQGKGENINFVRFDLVVTDAVALSLLLQHKDKIHEADNTKANITFQCYRIHTNPYIIQSGERAGKPAASLGGNLSRIGHLKLNGEVLYSSNDKKSNIESSDQTENETKSEDSAT